MAGHDTPTVPIGGWRGNRRLRAPVLLMLVLAALPVAVRAQDYSGNASRTTAPFRLAEGPAVFEMSHGGDGAFIVMLLDGEGREVSELVRAAGSYDGSRTLGIERAGEYMLDVRANGVWTVRLRPSPAVQSDVAAPGTGAPGTDSAGMTEGVAAGRAAAGGLDGKWVLGGLLAGGVAGPVGLGLAVHRAGSRATPAPPSPPRAELDFAEGFRRGFEERVRTNRRKSAFIGGMVGTAAFTAILIHILDISGSGSGSNDPGGGGPQLQIAR